MRDLTEPKKKKSPIVKIVVLALFFLAATIAIIYMLRVDKYAFKGPKTVVQLITNTGLQSTNGRVNVLILGIGGKGHEGPDLTDTLILASIDKNAKDVALVSIPRDLWVPTDSVKINHVYAYGEEAGGQGLESAANTVEELLGIPVHYAFRIDFNGFTKAVDLVGGLDINVETAFVDPKYPLAGKEDDLCDLTIETEDRNGVEVQVVKDATGSAIPLAEIDEKNDPFLCRYETLTFKKGPTTMDGTTTLKFVRSRHGTNGEGSDFARSARQQKVILAFREKVLSQETLLNPAKILDLIATFGSSIDTNISDEQIPLFAKMVPKISGEKIRRIVLDTTRPQSVLEFGLPQNHGGQSVVVPKNNNWEELKIYLNREIYPQTESQASQQSEQLAK